MASQSMQQQAIEVTRPHSQHKSPRWGFYGESADGGKALAKHGTGGWTDAVILRRASHEATNSCCEADNT